MSTYKEIQEEIGKMAGDTQGPDRFVVGALAHHVDAISLLDKQILAFNKSTQKTEREMKKLANAQVGLAITQVILAVAAIIAAVILQK